MREREIFIGENSTVKFFALAHRRCYCCLPLSRQKRWCWMELLLLLGLTHAVDVFSIQLGNV